MNGFIEAIQDLNEKALQADGFDDCIVGIVSGILVEPLLLYSEAKIKDKLVTRDGMTWEEAHPCSYWTSMPNRKKGGGIVPRQMVEERLTAQELADYYRVSKRTIYDWMKLGLPFVYEKVIGVKTRAKFLPSDVIAFHEHMSQRKGENNGKTKDD